MTKILALDPSTACIGWCVLDTETDRILDFGAFEPKGDDLDEKLASTHDWLDALAFRIPADAFAIELPIYHRNVKTLRTLAQLAGVLRFSAYYWTDVIIEILPSERRLAFGVPLALKAKPAKTQIRRLVNAAYGLELTADQHDIADAVAVAVAAQKKLRIMELQS